MITRKLYTDTDESCKALGEGASRTVSPVYIKQSKYFELEVHLALNSASLTRGGSVKTQEMFSLA